MASSGEEKTRCRAIVSSTTPRFDPRWPPVTDTLVTRKRRISAASADELAVAHLAEPFGRDRPREGGLGWDLDDGHVAQWVLTRARSDWRSEPRLAITALGS